MQGKNEMARITLSFDNGPEPQWTNHVLNVLADHDIKASFFVIGRKLAASPDGRKAVERAKREGHWIGNHSYNHVYSLGDIDRVDAVEVEVAKTFEVLGDLAHPDLLFRPFCNAGVLNERVFKRIDVRKICQAKYSCILFDTIPHDWDDGTGWVDRALKQVQEKAWSTIVLHDITGYPDGVDARPMLKLDEFIRQAKKAGHEFAQEYSPNCILIHRGRKLQDIDQLSH
jgi:peptidoglycan/xylan/chitin deacetylase (PgdA/CDA1 family)